MEGMRTDGQRSTLRAPSAHGAKYCHGYELDVWSWFVDFLNWISGLSDVRAQRSAGVEGAE